MSAIDVTEYAIGTPTAAARSENGTGAFVGADLTLDGTQIANAEDRGIQAAAATDGGRCPSRTARGATNSAVADAFEQSPRSRRPASHTSIRISAEIRIGRAAARDARDVICSDVTSSRCRTPAT